ncbi:MAG: glycosyltransferase family 2 protein [Candidatus Eiseniibacteriota bacterium]|jgi:glycosyltransferase involved in cell wall biosynthesis
MTTPCFSVVIPAYNAARTLPATLASVFAQTCQDYEVIVVDDGSTDATPSLLSGYGDRLRVVRKPNEGRPAAARNRGLEAARGTYVAFLDADDLWRPAKLECQLVLLDANPRLGLCYTAAALIDQDGAPLGEHRCPAEGRGRIYDLLSVRNIMVGSSVAARRAAILAAGGFDESLTSIENWDLWIRIARDWEVDFVDEPLTIYRKHAGNRSVDPELRRCNIFRILDRHHDATDRSPAARRRRREAYFNAYFLVLGIGYFGRLDMGPARAAFWHAFWLQPSVEVARYLALSLLGRHGFLALRALKRQLGGGGHDTNRAGTDGDAGRDEEDER